MSRENGNRQGFERPSALPLAHRRGSRRFPGNRPAAIVLLPVPQVLEVPRGCASVKRLTHLAHANGSNELPQRCRARRGHSREPPVPSARSGAMGQRDGDEAVPTPGVRHERLRPASRMAGARRSFLRFIFWTTRREALDGLAVFKYFGSVHFVSLEAPAIPRPGNELFA
jgi:hypothetical protein